MPIMNGRALPGLSAVAKKSFNPVFRGDALLDDGRVVRGFLKDLDPRQMANELLASVLGRRIGVNVPEVCLVAIGSDVSSDFTKMPHRNGGDFIAICSVDARASTVSQIFSTPEAASMFDALKAPPAMGCMYGFDTWIANVDRHADNILLSGDGRAHLIDHGHCLTGERWCANDLNSTKIYRNRLQDWLTPHLDLDERNRAMADVSRLVSRMASTDVHAAVEEAMLQLLCQDEDCDAVIGFLEGRVRHVTAMSAKYLGVLV